MKKMYFIVLVTILAVTGYTQQITTPAPHEKVYLLQKSKHQKTAAWVLLGGGFAMTTAGIFVSIHELPGNLVIYFAPEKKPSTTGVVLLIGGTASMLGSIPLFIASSGNKRKSRYISAFLKKETYQGYQRFSFIQLTYPAITLKLDL